MVEIIVSQQADGDFERIWLNFAWRSSPCWTPSDLSCFSGIWHAGIWAEDAPPGPLWTQDQAIAYEAVLEAINDVIAGYSEQIANEHDRPKPDTSLLE